MVGLYESAVDRLATWELAHGKRSRPKVVASTATARRAPRQIGALFDRRTEVFPPPGLDIDDSFFARQRPTAPDAEHYAPGRRYVGICAHGTRMKSTPAGHAHGPGSDLTAAGIVNTWDERELQTVLREYGEERFSRQIARAIVRRRASPPFTRSGDLVEVIKAAIPTPSRFGQGHPAKRTFQALRIATNDELESLRSGLETTLELLAPGGRFAVISFHSLEDRIVKRFIRDAARGCTCPPDFPVCVCGHNPTLRALTGRAVVPSVAERAENPRSASAKLRAAERTASR